jgi:hypothetical protein
MGGAEHARILAVCAYLLLTISVATGEMLSGRLAPLGRRRTLFGLHRMTAVAGLVAMAVHGISQMQVASGGHAVLGTAALASAGVPAIAWAARRNLAARWRLIHHTAYLAFALATIHVVAFHPPGMPPAEAAMYGSGVAAVVSLALWRAWIDRSGPNALLRRGGPHG